MKAYMLVTQKVRYGLIIQISFYHLLRTKMVIYTLYL
nr:MAG TPA: hypothetical protein [Bacteriophage sp.]